MLLDRKKFIYRLVYVRLIESGRLLLTSGVGLHNLSWVKAPSFIGTSIVSLRIIRVVNGLRDFEELGDCIKWKRTTTVGCFFYSTEADRLSHSASFQTSFGLAKFVKIETAMDEI